MTQTGYGNLPKTRAEARARGLDRFFTGNPCKHGHVVPRYVSTTNCVTCQLEHARRNGGWRARPSVDAYLDDARKRIELRGGVLLSTEYVSAKTKLMARCGDNHDFAITADSLKHGSWCPECKRHKQLKRMAANYWSVAELREFARARYGGDCLATEPSPQLSKTKWKCSNPEHQPFVAVLAKVIHSGQWCPLCWQDRREPPKPAIAFETVVETVRERGGEIVKVGKDGIWKGSKTRLAIRCANGHEWSSEASNLLYAGSWCPDCLHKGERIVRAIFEATFGGKFPKSKPEWLVSKMGRKLELDGYNQGQQIAFEYQGPHHFSIEQVITHDAIKRAVCAARGVRLIDVHAIKRPYPVENVLLKVVEAFARFGIKDAPRLPEDEIFAAEIKELRELAHQKRGQLISTVYLGSEPHEWKCEVPQHPSWMAEPWRIRKGAWCPSCAGNKRLGIDGLRKWGSTIGLDLLDTEYRGGTLVPYRWQCRKGAHTIARSRSNILQSLRRGLSPCPVCARTRPNSNLA